MRQITMFVFEVGFEKIEKAADGRYDLVRTPITTVEDSSLTKTDIRAAIVKAGYECPRGTDVYSEKVGKVLYYFETEDLMKIVKERKELDL